MLLHLVTGEALMKHRRRTVLRTISIRPELDAELKEAAARCNETISEVGRRAFRSFLDSEQRRSRRLTVARRAAPPPAPAPADNTAS
jgi:hypothetical protein